MFAAERRKLLVRRIARDGRLDVTEMARELGVSAMTVRRDLAALAHDDRIRRVHGGAVSAERTEDSGARIGLMVPDVDYYYRDVVAGAEEAARRSGHGLVVATHFYDIDLEKDRLARITGIAIDALIICTSGHDTVADDQAIRRLQTQWPHPIVLAERTLDQPHVGEPLSLVETDHRHGALLALHHLLAHGHDRVAALISATPTGRHLPAALTMAAHQLNIRVDLHELPRTQTPRTATVTHQCLDQGISALFVHSDLTAASVLDTVLARGLRVPEDVHLVSWDDVVAQRHAVPLTAVSPARRAIGAEAVRLAAARIDHPDAPIVRTSILPRLVVRQSSPRA